MILNADKLEAALKAYGVQVVRADGISSGHGQLGEILTITVHHTAGPTSGRRPSLGTVVKGRPDLDGPLCNAYVDRDGTWYLVSMGLAYHAGAVRSHDFQNKYNFGVEVESDGTQKFNTKQYAGMVKGFAALSDYFDLPTKRILRHADICTPKGRKIDARPLSMLAFRLRIGRAKPIDRSTKPAPHKPASTGDIAKLKTLQKLAGAKADGVPGPETRGKVTALMRGVRANTVKRGYRPGNDHVKTTAVVQDILGVSRLRVPRWGRKSEAAFSAFAKRVGL